MDQITEVFKALSNPTRQKLYRVLLQEELCVCELADIFDVSQPAISQHLRRLKAVKMVNDRREGQWVFYIADPKPLEEATQFMLSIRNTPLEDQADLEPELKKLRQVKRSNMCGLRAPDGELESAVFNGTDNLAAEESIRR